MTNGMVNVCIKSESLCLSRLLFLTYHERQKVSKEKLCGFHGFSMNCESFPNERSVEQRFFS